MAYFNGSGACQADHRSGWEREEGRNCVQWLQPVPIIVLVIAPHDANPCPEVEEQTQPAPLNCNAHNLVKLANEEDIDCNRVISLAVIVRCVDRSEGLPHKPAA